MIYCLPGLGTDHRIFQKLQLPERLCFLDWELPLPQESLKEYAGRMNQRIEHETPILLGLSFGGVVAQEMAAQINCRALILISSITHPQELPLQMKVWRKIPLYHLAQGDWRIKTLPIWAKGFGIHDKKEQALLRDMFQAADDRMRIWSIEQLINWKPSFVLADLPEHVRIHGKSDKVFPPRSMDESASIQWVEGGNHFMVYQKAAEVAQIVQEFLHQVSN